MGRWVEMNLQGLLLGSREHFEGSVVLGGNTQDLEALLAPLYKGETEAHSGQPTCDLC